MVKWGFSWKCKADPMLKKSIVTISTEEKPYDYLNRYIKII